MPFGVWMATQLNTFQGCSLHSQTAMADSDWIKWGKKLNDYNTTT
jgi:hypothetical protein